MRISRTFWKKFLSLMGIGQCHVTKELQKTLVAYFYATLYHSLDQYFLLEIYIGAKFKAQQEVVQYAGTQRTFQSKREKMKKIHPQKEIPYISGNGTF